MLRDGCFIIHLLLKQVENKRVSVDEKIVVDVEEDKGKAKVGVESQMVKEEVKIGGQMLGILWVLWVQNLVVFDLLKLESQIPFFVIRTIFYIIRTLDDEGLDLVNLALRLFHDIHPNKSKAFTAMPETQIHHLLHLFHSSLISYNAKSPPPLIPEWILGAIDLKRCGLRFKKETAECFLDVSNYKDGRIEIPPLQVYNYSKSPSFGISFANLLSSEGIVENWLGTDEVVADLFKRHNNLIQYASDGNYLANVFIEVKKYHKSKWRVQLIHKYFSNLWAGFAIIIMVPMSLLVAAESFLAVFFLLLLSPSLTFSSSYIVFWINIAFYHVLSVNSVLLGIHLRSLAVDHEGIDFLKDKCLYEGNTSVF